MEAERNDPLPVLQHQARGQELRRPELLRRALHLVRGRPGLQKSSSRGKKTPRRTYAQKPGANAQAGERKSQGGSVKPNILDPKWPYVPADWRDAMRKDEANL